MEFLCVLFHDLTHITLFQNMPNLLNFDLLLCNYVKVVTQSYLTGLSKVFKNLFYPLYIK